MLRFNENNEILQEFDYQAILVGLSRGEDISYSMDELAGLAEAADMTVLGQVVQNLEKPNKATLIGKGKVEEMAEMAANMEADIVIFNDELTGMQLRNLEDVIGVRVIDRTILILDIFASRATSKEGKLQVELAQLKYRLPRLTGFGKSLSRLGGGIGTRGPGEKKLETDRRHIERRMDDIKAEITQIKNNRTVQRAKRAKSELPIVALVGYTNSGKSALMNRLLQLTDKEEKSVTEKDMLFATLDTQHRSVKLDTNSEFILVDTVGFVSKLPHSLVSAFKATLEEVTYADLLIQVVDASYEASDFHVDVTNKVLDEIGAGQAEKIIAFNKIDLVEQEPIPVAGADNVFISAKEDINIDKLIELIKAKVFGDRVTAELLIPFSRGDLSSFLCQKAKVFAMEYVEEGTLFTVELAASDYQRLKEYDTI
ncbi:MAG TPA: GTPase HflX [Anaerovoracaceae bacterium]|nr:GTPase HflX [Anaerovoracaceae bacterium]